MRVVLARHFAGTQMITKRGSAVLSSWLIFFVGMGSAEGTIPIAEHLNANHLHPGRQPDETQSAATMSLEVFLLIALLFALVGVVPLWPHTANWGYWPSGLVALALVAVAAFMVAEGVS